MSVQTTSIRECRKCLRYLADNAGDDCPTHTLPCCGGTGIEHKPDCEQNSMYQAGNKAALDMEKRLLDLIGGL